MSSVKRYLWLTGLLEQLGYKYDASFEGKEIVFTNGVQKVFFDEKDFEKYRIEGSLLNIAITKDNVKVKQNYNKEVSVDKTTWDKVNPLEKRHNHTKAYSSNLSTGIRHYSISWNTANKGYVHQIRFDRENKTYVVMRETLYSNSINERFAQEAERLNTLLKDKGVSYVIKNAENLFVGYCGYIVKGGKNNANQDATQ